MLGRFFKEKKEKVNFSQFNEINQEGSESTSEMHESTSDMCGLHVALPPSQSVWIERLFTMNTVMGNMLPQSRSFHEKTCLKEINKDDRLDHQVYYKNRFYNYYFCTYPITDQTDLLIDLLLISPSLFQIYSADIENNHLTHEKNDMTLDTMKINNIQYRYTLYIPMQLSIFQNKLNARISEVKGNAYLNLDIIEKMKTEFSDMKIRAQIEVYNPLENKWHIHKTLKKHTLFQRLSFK